jgi:hypothetical protein
MQLHGLPLQLGALGQGVGEAGPGEHGEGSLPTDLSVGKFWAVRSSSTV